MLDIILGNYIQAKFKAFFETIVFQVTVAAGSESTGANTTTKYLADSEDGSTQKAELDTNSFIIFSAWTLCETGHVKINIIPDADTKLKFRVDATQADKITPVSPPMIAQVDIQIDFINSQFQPNNTHLVLHVLRIPDDQLPAFASFAEGISLSLGNIDLQTLNAHNDLLTVISLLSQLITLQGGTASYPPGYSAEYITRRKACPTKRQQR